MHRDKQYFGDDAEEFCPGRFLGEDKKYPALLSFSAGPGACAGQKFAELESLALLNLLMSEYKITIKGDHKPKPFVLDFFLSIAPNSHYCWSLNINQKGPRRAPFVIIN